MWVREGGGGKDTELEDYLARLHVYERPGIWALTHLQRSLHKNILIEWLKEETPIQIQNWDPWLNHTTFCVKKLNLLITFWLAQLSCVIISFVLKASIVKMWTFKTPPIFIREKQSLGIPWQSSG